jgi:putative transposase
MKAMKSVSFAYTAPLGLSDLFEDFRLMCNDAIRIAVAGKPKNRLELIESAYATLRQYGLHTHYALSACEVAYSVCGNKNGKSVPYVRRAFLKLDNQSYQLDHMILRIPFHSSGSGHDSDYIFIALQGSNYQLSFIDDPGLKRGSVTITPNSVIISFSREVEPFEPTGFIGVDINERNATLSATDGWTRKFSELGEVAEIKQRYREIRAGISRKTRGDRRITKMLLSKYGQRERNRTQLRLHRVTSQIVDYAKDHTLGIKMEKLKGIRKRYRKRNSQGKLFRGRMNTWVFGEVQSQVEYKSKWGGVPLWYVNPRGTSSYCLCGSRVVRLADRKLYCPTCDRTWDRDDLASKNVMACAVPQARPSRGSDEGGGGDDGSRLRSRWREGKFTWSMTTNDSQNQRNRERKKGNGRVRSTSACQS